MRRLVPILLLAAAPAIAGDRIARHGADEIRVMEAACPYASVLRFIPEAQRTDYRKAEGRVNGQRYFACWRDVGEALHLWWEDGDQGLLPTSMLEDAPSV